jgi:hypothetical protein
MLAGMIPPGSHVIEFGAGRRALESFLPPNCSYTPSDLVDRGPGTLICDLNRRPLPDLRNLSARVAVFAGVLEYIHDVATLTEWLSLQVQSCVASYECIRSEPRAARRVVEMMHRASRGYVSHHTENELIALFEGTGFSCIRAEAWRDQKIFLFEKNK